MADGPAVHGHQLGDVTEVLGPQAVWFEGELTVRVYCPVCNHLQAMPWEGPLPMRVATDPGCPGGDMSTCLDWRPLLPFVERFRGVLADRCPRTYPFSDHMGAKP